MVRARLERHVQRRAAGPLARRFERDDLGVAPGRLGRALADDLAVAHEHGTDGRLRIRPAARIPRQLERASEAHASSWTSRR